MFCENCGRHLEDGAGICPGCNTWIGEDKKERNMRALLKRGAGIVFVMAIALFLSFQTKAYAEETKFQMGDNVWGVLDDAGTLTISGTGDMWELTPYEDEEKTFHYKTKRKNPAYGAYVVVIEEGVTSIGARHFSKCDTIQSVSIPSTVKMIGEYSFYDCDGLYRITIPGNVHTIGAGAFENCMVNSCTLSKGLMKIDYKAFYDCELKSIVIPEGVASVEMYAFNTLENVTISKGVGILKEYAFKCNAAADFLSNDVIIGENAFGRNATFIADRGSSAETYAKNHSQITLKYHQYASTVSFNGNGGTPSYASKSVLSEAVYGALPTAKRAKYEFLGWFTLPAGGTQVTAETMVTTTTNTVLYAHWAKVKVAKPKKPSVSSKRKGRMNVTIQPVSGAIGYQIRYSWKSGMKSAKMKLTKKLTKNFKNLKKGKKYYVQVRAYKLDSAGQKVYGKWSGKSKVVIKKKTINQTYSTYAYFVSKFELKNGVLSVEVDTWKIGYTLENVNVYHDTLPTKISYPIAPDCEWGNMYTDGSYNAGSSYAELKKMVKEYRSLCLKGIPLQEIESPSGFGIDVKNGEVVRVYSLNS